MEGEHAYRTFKSLIHHNMIAVLCFELNITLEEYEAMCGSLGRQPMRHVCFALLLLP